MTSLYILSNQSSTVGVSLKCEEAEIAEVGGASGWTQEENGVLSRIFQLFRSEVLVFGHIS